MATPHFSTDLLCSLELSDTKVEQDAHDPYLYDVVILEVEGVHVAVVTDFANKCVKSFYITNKKTSCSRLQLNDKPQDMTRFATNKVLVAVSGAKQIVTVAVTPDLIYETCINTSKSYSSLGVIAPSLLVVCGWGQVDIVNLQGEVLKSVITHNNTGLFAYPRHLCISNSGYLLVSDIWKTSVTCLTSEGQVCWTYTGKGKRRLKFPTGLTTTSDGDILVADSHLKKVIQLSESGKYVRDVLTSQDGLTYPLGICFDKHGSLFSCDSSNLLKSLFVRK